MMDAACWGVPGPLWMNMRTCYPYAGVEFGRYCLETMDLLEGPLTAAPLYSFETPRLPKTADRLTAHVGAHTSNCRTTAGIAHFVGLLWA